MRVTDFFGLFGGLALFLHGMQMMSSGLEAAAGNRLKSILERLTANRFLGVLVGAAITAAVQSSSATTVMVVGFVNAGMMSLNQAVWVIMGANVGTTVTGILVSLDIGELAPLLAFVGVVLAVFGKKQRLQHQILTGLGILFLRMEMMTATMKPLRGSPLFVSLLSNFSNPLLGILFGALITALIQSSSAVVGILQSLSETGVLPFGSAVFVLFGTNVGTCITALMSSAGANRSAKRVTLIHLLFNVIGTALFTALVLVFPITQWVQAAVTNPLAQIAAMHTLFNLVTTAVLLPLSGWLARLAHRILPEREGTEPEEDTMHLRYLRPVNLGGGLGVSVLVIGQLRRELNRMLDFARENVDAGFRAVKEGDASGLEAMEQREDYIDFLNREISGYVSQLIPMAANEGDSTRVSSYFSISGNIERIGDHADNLAGYARILAENGITFSDVEQAEIEAMRVVCRDAMTTLLETHPNVGSALWLSAVAQKEQRIDDMTEQFRRRQLKRMQSGTGDYHAGILYSELLTDFERIGDHILNIAQALNRAGNAR